MAAIEDERDNLPVLWQGMGEGPSISRAERAIRYQDALNARAKGASYDQIGDLFHISKESAINLVKRALKETLREPGDEVRKLELMRLDELYVVYYAKALDGHGPSLDRCLNIMERRARIEGIDAPVEIDYASIRSQFFHVLRQVMPPEDVARVLQAMAEVRT